MDRMSEPLVPFTGEAPPTATPSALTTPRVRLGAWSLALGSLQFFIAMAVEQALRPGYLAVGPGSNTISDLGVNIDGWGYAWIFDGSIIVLGALAIAGIIAIYPILPRSSLSYPASYVLAMGCVGAIGVGLFTEQSTWMGGHAHDYFSVWTFAWANFGLFLMGLAMWGDSRWGRYALLTTFLGILSTIALGFYIQNILTNGAFFGLGEGGLERVVAFPVLLWAILVGVVILRRASLEGRSLSRPSAVPSAGSAS